jgi:ribosomal protein L19E
VLTAQRSQASMAKVLTRQEPKRNIEENTENGMKSARTAKKRMHTVHKRSLRSKLKELPAVDDKSTLEQRHWEPLPVAA